MDLCTGRTGFGFIKSCGWCTLATSRTADRRAQGEKWTSKHSPAQSRTRCFAWVSGCRVWVVIVMMPSASGSRDISILEQELLLADLQSAERRLERKPPARAGAAGAAAHALLRRAADALAEGRPARSLAPTLSREEAGLWPALQLLTQKPQLFVCNVSEEDLRGGGTGNAMVAAVSAALAARADGALPPLIVSAQVEAEAAQLADGDRSELLGEYGLSATGIDAVVRAAGEAA